MFELIIFDCDGVLVNSESVYIDVELRILEEAGMQFDRAAYVREMTGLSERAWLARVEEITLERTGRPLPEGFVDDLFDRYQSGLDRELAALPMARSTIETLAPPVCVASSSSTARLEWKLRHTDLYDLFDPHVYSADLVENGKPAPDLFLLAASRFGTAPDGCLVIEDSPNGVLAGKAAGMQVIGLIAGGHCLPDHDAMLREAGADAIAEHFEEIGPLAADWHTS